MTRFQSLFEEFYLRHRHGFKAELISDGDPAWDIKRLADDTYEELDIIALEGAVFREGNCQVCSRIIA